MVNFIVDGITYNCCEQYMMHQKALLFKDYETAKLIMEATHPRDHQSLGRSVKNFDEMIWNMHKYKIVVKGNYHRFTQSEEDKNWLLATTGLLVEASPIDRVWGVGLSASDPLIQDEKNWRGYNLLGQALTEVRETIKKESHASC